MYSTSSPVLFFGNDGGVHGFGLGNVRLDRHRHGDRVRQVEARELRLGLAERSDDELDLDAEPRSALVAGHDGLDAIRHIASHAREHLTAGGWLLLEHGYNQGESVRQLLHGAGFGDNVKIALFF